jgi:hypothetical protein
MLALVGSVACNLSEMAGVTLEPEQVQTVETEATQPVTLPIAVASPEVIIVEVTTTPQPTVEPSPVDIEEQLVTSVYSRVGPAVVCVVDKETRRYFR